MKIIRFGGSAVLCLLILVGFTPIKYSIAIPPVLFKAGVVGAEVPNPSVKVATSRQSIHIYWC